MKHKRLNLFLLVVLWCWGATAQEVTYGFVQDPGDPTALTAAIFPNFSSPDVGISNSAVFTFLMPAGTVADPAIPADGSPGLFTNVSGMWAIQKITPALYASLGNNAADLAGFDLYLATLQIPLDIAVTVGQPLSLFSFSLPSDCAGSSVQVLTNGGPIQQAILTNLGANFNNAMPASINNGALMNLYAGNHPAQSVLACPLDIDDMPVAIDDIIATNEDMAIDIDVLDNDVFGLDGPSSGAITVTVPPSMGIAVVDTGLDPADPSDDRIVYTPFANFFGADMFTYEICDTDGDCVEAQVFITVQPMNDLPLAGNDAVTFSGSGPLVIDVLTNDDFGGDGPGSFQILTGPSDGMAMVNGNGTAGVEDDFIEYTPVGNFQGTDQLAYEICDANGDCATAIVTIGVNTFCGWSVSPNTITLPACSPGVNATISLTVDCNGFPPLFDPQYLSVTLKLQNAELNLFDFDYSDFAANGYVEFKVEIPGEAGGQTLALTALYSDPVLGAPSEVNASIAILQQPPATSGLTCLPVSTNLDEFCSAELSASMFLTGGAVCDDLFLVWVEGEYDQAGNKVYNRVTRCGTFKYYIYLKSTGVQVCWNYLTADDHTPPEIQVPRWESYIPRLEYFSRVEGQIDNGPFWPARFSCWQAINIDQDPASWPNNGQYYYDTVSFKIPKDGFYTFTVYGHDFQFDYDLTAALFQGNFDPERPCENILAFSDYTFRPNYPWAGLGFQQYIQRFWAGGNGTTLSEAEVTPWVAQTQDLIRAKLLLRADQTYTFVTTTHTPGFTGIQYELLVSRDDFDSELDSEIILQPNNWPYPVTRYLDFAELLCEDVDYFLGGSTVCVKNGDRNSRQYQLSDSNGSTIPVLGKYFWPTVIENCDPDEVTLCFTDKLIEYGDCGVEEVEYFPNSGTGSSAFSFTVAKKIKRTWTVTDAKGQTSEQLEADRTTYFKFRLPTVYDVFLPHFTAAVECDEDYPVIPGTDRPSPDITGYPFLESAFKRVVLTPNNGYCNLAASYDDFGRVNTCDAGFRFRREWTIYDLCRPGTSIIYQQLIKVGDFTAPEFEVTVPEINTGPFTCTGAFRLPVPEIQDNCSSNFTIQVQVLAFGEETSIVVNIPELSATNNTVSGLPQGDHIARYTVTDHCGNRKVADVPVNIIDKSAPVAVCDDVRHVTLGGDGLASIQATRIDEGSWDSCWPVKAIVRRALSNTCLEQYAAQVHGLEWPVDYEEKQCPAPDQTSTCYYAKKNVTGLGIRIGDPLIIEDPSGKLFTYWADEVRFTCCDIDQLIGVELRVIEIRDDGRAPRHNTCWFETLIEDKTGPVLDGLPVAMIECDEIPTNPADTLYWQSKYGKPAGFDNCSANVLELPPVVELNACGEGTITRFFQAEEDFRDDPADILRSGISRQIIQVKLVHDYWICFPKDAEATCGGDPNPDTLRYDEIGCDLLAVSVTDEPFAADTDECYKIFRTYRVLNWCEYDGEGEPNIICRDEDGDGLSGDEDVYVRRIAAPVSLPISNGHAGNSTKNLLVFIDSDSNPFNKVPVANHPERAAAGKTNANPEGFWWAIPDFQYQGMCNRPVTPASARGESSRLCGEGLIKYVAPANAPSTHPWHDFRDFRSPGHCFEAGFWQYTQVIKVYDNAEPTITVLTPNLDFCSFDSPEEDDLVCEGPVTISLLITDVCSQEAVQLREVWLAPFNGVFQNQEGILYTVDRESLTITAPSLPIGEHTFRVRATDGCGNSRTLEIPFSVVDCKPPSPSCIDGLAFELMPLDIDGDGLPEERGASVMVMDFLAPSQPQDCNEPVKYFIKRELTDPDSAFLNLRCADLTLDSVYIVAEDSKGNRDYCVTGISVQANLNPCAGEITITGEINGWITTEEDEAVEDVAVYLSGRVNNMMETETDGTYRFGRLQQDYDYSVAPQLDRDYLNGVTTYDLVLITKHILGVQPLDSPYKLIAADANNSRSVTTQDLIHLRRLILGIEATLRNNQSWRFVDASYRFPDATNPWRGIFPEVINVNDLRGLMAHGDFVAVKIGDVNSSARANRLMRGTVRSTSGPFYLDTEEQQIEAGREFTVPFRASGMESIEGYQFTLGFDPATIELVDVFYGAATAEHFGWQAVSEGLITTSWNQPAGRTISGDAELFALTFRAGVSGKLSDHLNISSRITYAEAYDRQGQPLEVALRFSNGIVAQRPVELYQNKPNPFAESTVIGFFLPRAAKATIKVYDAKGQVLKLIRDEFAPGENNIVLERKDLPASGVLYYTLQTNDFTQTKKMILVE